MRILVTGGAGHLGSHVCDLLVEQGHEVYSVDSGHYLGDGVVYAVVNGVHESAMDAAWMYDDVNGPALPQWRGVDVVFHLAANANVQATTKNPSMVSRNGSSLTRHVLEFCASENSKMVFVSSAIVHYAPTLPYAIEKDAGEKYCQHYTKHFGVPTSIIRLNNVYGSPRHKPSSGNLIPCLLEQKRTKGRITVTGDGSQVRDFVHYTDAIKAIVAAADREGITEIGSCVGKSIREVAELFDCPIDYVPRPGGEVDRQVCEQSDYETTVNFEETIRELARSV